MANPGNQHCANCIGTLSFHIAEVKRFLSPCILYIIITQASRCCRSQYYSAFQWTGKPTKFPFPPGRSGTSPMVHWAKPSPQPKWYLDRFI